MDEKAMPKLGGQFDGYFHAVTFYGAVHRVGLKNPEKLLRYAICPNDGEAFSIEDLKP